MAAAEVQRIARAHYRRRQELARFAAARARRFWLEVDRGNIAGSWRSVLPRLLAVLTAAQLTAAEQSQEYVAGVLAAQGAGEDFAGVLVPSRLAGVASDGRALDSLLYLPAIGTLTDIRDGASVGQAMQSGMAQLITIAATQIQDAGRVADGVNTVAHRRARGYVRMLSPPSCSRCVVLAGKFYRSATAFNRHERCDCVNLPAAESLEEVRTSPRQYFDALSDTEQDKTFTKAGAAAIREGADIAQVVNARRGMTAAGTTTEGMTRRGFAGRRLADGSTQRLMPEAIFQLANDRDDVLRLLRLHGYIA